MRKCDKKRISKIKVEQKFQRCRKRIVNAYANAAGSKPESELFNNPDFMPAVVNSLSTKTLRMVVERPDYFDIIGHEILVRLAKDILVERTFQLEEEK